MHINFSCKDIKIFAIQERSFTEICFVKTKVHYNPALAQNKLLAMDVSNLLSKGDVLVNCDMFSISALDIITF